MHYLLPIFNTLSTLRISALSITIFFLIEGIFGGVIPHIMVYLNICLIFIIIHMITEIIRYHYIKDTTIITTLFLAGFWIAFINVSNLEIFIVDNTYQLQTFINSITLSILLIYLYQNLRRLFTIFKKINIGYRLLITLSFLLVISVGTVLLMLPISTPPLSPNLTLVNAFFTAVSAVCVTGLVVVDTATYFSRFGQLIIMCLVQIGSLGLVTITTTLVALLGRKLSLTNQISAKSSLSASNNNSLTNYLGFALGFTLVVEIVIAIILFSRFSRILPLEDAIFYSIFHAITAFCNAGFSLFSDSLMGFRNDLTINFAIMGSIIIGGIGFGVWLDLKSRFIERKTKSIALQTSIALQMSLYLLILGTIAFFFLEKDNTLMGLSLSEKILSSLFTSVNLRTAGFNSIDLNQTNESSRLLSTALMYIGASPGSTGGGIKTTTFLVLLAYVRASLKNSPDITIFGKRVEDSLAHQAWTLVFNSLCWIFFVTLSLCYIDGFSLSEAVYETVSAYATVGVSTGVTGSLSNISKVLISITMILGRVGPTTIMLALNTSKPKSNLTRTPTERLSIG
ncbi:MAG: TrkH family potassium uptake protein [Brevinema sp.]